MVLLAGEMNIFRDNIYIGKSEIENTIPNEEFTINLGIDESLKIDRQLVEREVDKKFISGQKRVTYAYKINIANLKEQVIDLKLVEQIPKSRNEQIKVNLSATSPKIQTSKMGDLEWFLKLNQGQQQSVYYQFTIESPPNLNLIGLNILK